MHFQCKFCCNDVLFHGCVPQGLQMTSQDGARPSWRRHLLAVLTNVVAGWIVIANDVDLAFAVLFHANAKLHRVLPNNLRKVPRFHRSRLDTKSVHFYLVVPCDDCIFSVDLVIWIRRVEVINVLAEMIVRSVLHQRATCKVLKRTFSVVHKRFVSLQLTSAHSCATAESSELSSSGGTPCFFLKLLWASRQPLWNWLQVEIK